ncbi:S-adenosyl-L-methionine-dependent methyltransferase [Chlamydoabsidia padenii]|nr:S-adenosyl-L-methionine-dependent methyltransferase [Chlamydoabsidia padenii]
MEYTTTNGRKYINTTHSRYFLPCDEEETDRLIVLHFLLKYAFNTNYISPVQSLLQGGSLDDRPKVLDIGTGAGTWTLEMASEFSETDFYGIDLAPMYPSTIKPNNAYFQQHDMLDGLPFPDESFDFIYMRQMMTAVSKQQCHALLTEIARVLKPNGYLEIVDVEYQIQRPGPISSSLINKHLQQKMAMFNIESDLCTQLSTLLMTIKTNQGGFIDTMQHKVTMPLGWGGQLGDLHAHNLELFLRSLNPDITQASLTEEAIQHTLRECKKYQSHLNWYAFTARKSPPCSPSPTRQGSSACSLSTDCTSTTPPTPPSEPLEWESINSFVTGYIE